MEVQETRIPEKEEEKKNEQKLEEKKIIKTIFKVNKSLGDPYFRKTKVDSCSHILVSNGKTLAVSFGIKNRRGRNLNQYQVNYQLINQHICKIITLIQICMQEWEKNL